MTEPARHTDITILLDRSGSMESMREETVAGFNTFLNQQKQEPGTASLTLIQFDNRFELHYKCVPLDEVTDLAQQDFVPRGGTALLDAMGRTINGTRRRIRRLPEASRPDQVIVVILTDGLENASHHYSLQRVNRMVAAGRKTDWKFIFIGADQDAIASGRQLGIADDYSIRFSRSREAVSSTWGTLHQVSSRIRREGSAASGFTDEERTSSMGEEPDRDDEDRG